MLPGMLACTPVLWFRIPNGTAGVVQEMPYGATSGPTFTGAHSAFQLDQVPAAKRSNDFDIILLHCSLPHAATLLERSM